jgi:pyridoxamine 5'-phosphate oxidase
MAPTGEIPTIWASIGVICQGQYPLFYTYLNMSVDDIASLRNDYTEAGIRQGDLPDNPFDLFTEWFEQALAAGLPEANGMVIATSGEEAMPSQRTVLMKSFDRDGFYFFTNYESRKGRELARNSRISCLFPWLALHRQVEFQGRVERADKAHSADYFSSRPRGSQVGAWASRQSEVLADRETLEARVAEVGDRFGEGKIPLPDFWGGFHVIPERVEFWQGRTSRLHDRFVYTRAGRGEDRWNLERLYP